MKLNDFKFLRGFINNFFPVFNDAIEGNKYIITFGQNFNSLSYYATSNSSVSWRREVLYNGITNYAGLLSWDDMEFTIHSQNGTNRQFLCNFNGVFNRTILNIKRITTDGTIIQEWRLFGMIRSIENDYNFNEVLEKFTFSIDNATLIS